MWRLVCLICILFYHPTNGVGEGWTIKGKHLKSRVYMVIEHKTSGFELEAHNDAIFGFGEDDNNRGDGHEKIYYFREYRQLMPKANAMGNGVYLKKAKFEKDDKVHNDASILFENRKWNKKKGDYEKGENSVKHKPALLNYIKDGKLRFKGRDGQMHQVKEGGGKWTIGDEYLNEETPAHVEDENIYSDDEENGIVMWDDDYDEAAMLYEETVADLRRAQRQFELAQHLMRRSARRRRGRNRY